MQEPYSRSNLESARAVYKYILLYILVCSIAVYFYESCSILMSKYRVIFVLVSRVICTLRSSVG